MNYDNLTFCYDNDYLKELTHAYFKKSNITIGQITRKLYSYLQSLVRLPLPFTTYRYDFGLGYRDTQYVNSNGVPIPDLSSCYLDINLRGQYPNVGMFDDGVPLWSIRIGYRYPSTFLYPFFKRFWDNNPYMDGIPIKNSSITLLTPQGIFELTQEFYFRGKEPLYGATDMNTFAVMFIYKEKVPFLKFIKGKWNGLIWGKKHYEVLDVSVSRRGECHRDKSVVVTVDKLIKQLSGRFFLISPSNKE